MSGEGWRSMVSAPKDGTMVQVRWRFDQGREGIERMRWDGDLKTWVTRSGRTFLGPSAPDAWRPLGGES